MGAQEGPADPKRVGWRFHFPVCLGILGGFFIVVLTEAVNAVRPLAPGLRDTALVIGGMFMGLVGLCLNEVYRTEPERAAAAAEHELERRRHQEERRLDFEQYRSLQAELRDAKSRVVHLQAKLDLTGAIDRDRVGDAMLLGFYFHRRADRLPSSSGRSIFETAAQRLKVLLGDGRGVRLEKPAVRDVLEIAYGNVVAESFDLGYLLSHLGEDGSPATTSPYILAELERHLKALRTDAELRPRNGVVSNTSVFARLASRVISIVRGRS